jgi:hypothetical protein
MYLCAGGIDFASSAIFLLDVGTSATVWRFWFYFISFPIF